METKRNIRNIPSFKEFINEAPQKMKGNAPFDELDEYLYTITERGIKDKYVLAKQNLINGLDLYVRDKNWYILGYFDNILENSQNKLHFIVVNEFDVDIIHNFTSQQKQLNNKMVGKINTIHTHTKWQFRGISSALYNYIVDSGIVLISDDTQYQGAVNLWKNFPSVKNAVVYVYDILEDKIIKKYTQNTPESHVWSDNASKQRIRLVFTKLTKT